VKQINSLKEQNFDMQRQSRDELMAAIVERDHALEKAQKLQKQLEKNKNMPKPITLSLNEETISSARSNQQTRRL